MKNDNVVFICTHGRPHRQKTLETLHRCNYTGKWYLVLDDTDATIQEYIDTYGPENIIIFNKQHYIDTTDIGVNKGVFNIVAYARKAVEDIALDMGISGFIVADDDIEDLAFRWPEKEKVSYNKIYNLDGVISAILEFMLTCNISSLGLGNTSTYIKGLGAFEAEKLSKCRIPFTIIFRNVKYKVDWHSWYGEDICTAIYHQVRGQYWMNIIAAMYSQPKIASMSGGMAEAYKNNLEWERNWVVFSRNVSCIKIKDYKGKATLYINKNEAFPNLISSKYKRR